MRSQIVPEREQDKVYFLKLLNKNCLRLYASILSNNGSAFVKYAGESPNSPKKALFQARLLPGLLF